MGNPKSGRGWAYIGCEDTYPGGFSRNEDGDDVGKHSMQYRYGNLTVTGSKNLYVTTGSGDEVDEMFLTGNLHINGTLLAKNYNIVNVTEVDTQGSTRFGDSTDDKHIFTGSIDLVGALTASQGAVITGYLTADNQTLTLNSATVLDDEATFNGAFTSTVPMTVTAITASEGILITGSADASSDSGLLTITGSASQLGTSLVVYAGDTTNADGAYFKVGGNTSDNKGIYVQKQTQMTTTFTQYGARFETHNVADLGAGQVGLNYGVYSQIGAQGASNSIPYAFGFVSEVTGTTGVLLSQPVGIATQVGVASNTVPIAMINYDHAETENYSYISTVGDGATTFATVHGAGTNAHFTASVDGGFKVDAAEDIILDADTGIWRFQDAGSNIFEVNNEGNPAIFLYDDGDVNDFFKIDITDNGETTINTTDSSAEAAHLTLSPDGHLLLNPATDQVHITGSSGLIVEKVDSVSDVDTSSGNFTSNVYGISHTLTLNAALADDTRHADIAVTDNKVLASSVVVGNASVNADIHIHTVVNGSFKFAFTNRSGGALADDSTIVFNFIVF